MKTCNKCGSENLKITPNNGYFIATGEGIHPENDSTIFATQKGEYVYCNDCKSLAFILPR